MQLEAVPQETLASGKAPSRIVKRNILRGLLLTSAASACTYTRVPQDPTPGSIAAGENVGVVHLTLKSGRKLTLYDVRLKNDSIVGFDKPLQSRSGLDRGAQRIAVYAPDVAEVMTSKGERIKVGVNTGLALLAAVVAVGTLVAVSMCLNGLKTT